jgi:hypothetical protein
MRSLIRASAVVAASFALASEPCDAQTPPAPLTARTCAFDGLWTARASGFTTRIQGGRWRTWSGITIDERTPPAGSGWLEITRDRMTFDFENGRTGYGYSYAFEDGCDVLHLTGVAEILFVRTAPPRTR